MRHPKLGGRKAQFAGQTRQGSILRRIADTRLMTQHFVGQIVAANLGQRHGGADIGHAPQVLPVGCIQIGG